MGVHHDAAYRGTERTPRIVVSERGRARAGMLALAAIAMVLGATFATTARLTLSCTRSKVKASEQTVVSCYVEQAGAWTRSSELKTFRDPKAVHVERLDGRTRVTVDGQLLLESPLEPDRVERLAKETALVDTYGDHALGHAGGWVVDLRVVLLALGAATLSLLLAFRHHRVVVDREEEEIRATSAIAFLPFRTQRASLRAGDRVVARVEGARATLLLAGSRGPIVLLEDDARGGSVERLAERVDALLPRAVEG